MGDMQAVELGMADKARAAAALAATRLWALESQAVTAKPCSGLLTGAAIAANIKRTNAMVRQRRAGNKLGLGRTHDHDHSTAHP